MFWGEISPTLALFFLSEYILNIVSMGLWFPQLVYKATSTPIKFHACIIMVGIFPIDFLFLQDVKS